VADRFTVLRDGQAVGGGRVGEVTRERIVELMVGRTVTEQYPRIPHTIGEPVLELRDLVGDELPLGASLTLRRGEILGVAGIVGSGRTEMLRAVYGLDPVRSGRVRVGAYSGEHAAPAERIAQGVGMVSEDRKTEGLALDLSIGDNVALSRLDARGGFLSRARLRAAVSDVLARFGVKFRDANQPVGELSGGNQQKVAIARLFHQRADVLLLDEPTKGVDIGSKADIYRKIGEAAASGKAVLVMSSYLPELFGVADTLAVMCKGKLTAARPIGEWTPEQVIAVATGAANS
jgi:ribose transport system ATP-binding protein